MEDKKILIVNGDNSISESSYLSFLDDYLTDETCTPSGIGAKYFFEDLGEDEGANRFQLCHWSSGSKVRGNVFKETLEDCEDWLYQIKEMNLNSGIEYPAFFDTRKEAEDYLIDMELI